MLLRNGPLRHLGLTLELERSGLLKLTCGQWVNWLAGHLKDPGVKMYAGMLKRHLPDLMMTDAPSVNRKALNYMHWSLMGADRELVLAILGAFEKVGNRRVIRNVARLAQGKGPTANDPAVRLAAQQCLEILEGRAAIEDHFQREDDENRRLLRPASSVSGDNDTLVRPAAGGGSENTSLLRAASPDKDSKGSQP